MELKCAGGYPMWMVKFLSEHKIYKTSFSKYGTAYQTMIWPELQRKRQEAKQPELVRKPAFPKFPSQNRIPARGRVAALRHA